MLLGVLFIALTSTESIERKASVESTLLYTLFKMVENAASFGPNLVTSSSLTGTVVKLIFTKNVRQIIGRYFTHDKIIPQLHYVTSLHFLNKIISLTC